MGRAIIFSYFIIHEISIIRSITLLCTAKEVLVKQIAFTNILRTEVSSKLFYSLTIVFFPTNSLDKASKLLFIFVRVRKGYAPFQLEAIG